MAARASTHAAPVPSPADTTCAEGCSRRNESRTLAPAGWCCPSGRCCVARDGSPPDSEGLLPPLADALPTERTARGSADSTRGFNSACSEHTSLEPASLRVSRVPIAAARPPPTLGADGSSADGGCRVGASQLLPDGQPALAVRVSAAAAGSRCSAVRSSTAAAAPARAGCEADVAAAARELLRKQLAVAAVAAAAAVECRWSWGRCAAGCACMGAAVHGAAQPELWRPHQTAVAALSEARDQSEDSPRRIGIVSVSSIRAQFIKSPGAKMSAVLQSRGSIALSLRGRIVWAGASGTVAPEAGCARGGSRRAGAEFARAGHAGGVERPREREAKLDPAAVAEYKKVQCPLWVPLWVPSGLIQAGDS
jgi:hypothetical protein